MAQILETSTADDLDATVLNSTEISAPRQIAGQYKTIVRFQSDMYLMMGLVLVGGIVALTQSVKQSDPAATLGLAAVGLGMILFAVVYVVNHLRKPRVTVSVYPSRMIMAWNGTEYECPWEDVTAVWQNIVTFYSRYRGPGTRRSYTILLNNGRKFHLDDSLGNIAELGQTIQAEVTRRLLPKAVTLLNTDEPVEFGRITLHKAYFQVDDKTLAWAEVEDLKLDNGYLRIKKVGQWLHVAQISAADIPNLYVFLNLVPHLINTRK